MAKSIIPCSIEEIRKLYSYDPLTGILTRTWSRRDDMLGPITHDHAYVFGHKVSVARVIWAVHYGYWPENLVDHRNRNRKDNTIGNLREATHTQNQYNKVQENIHGYKGVTWRDRKRNPWLSKIRVNSVRINLGSFPTKEAAAEAYERACVKYHGEFAQLGVK